MRFAYLAATTTVSLLRLLPMSDRDKDLEIIALRHQLMVLQRQVGKPAFTGTDRLILAGLLHHLPREKLRNLLLLVRPGNGRALAPRSARAATRRDLRAEASRTPVTIASTWDLPQVPTGAEDPPLIASIHVRPARPLRSDTRLQLPPLCSSRSCKRAAGLRARHDCSPLSNA